MEQLNKKYVLVLSVFDKDTDILVDEIELFEPGITGGEYDLSSLINTDKYNYFLGLAWRDNE